MGFPLHLGISSCISKISLGSSPQKSWILLRKRPYPPSLQEGRVVMARGARGKSGWRARSTKRCCAPLCRFASKGPKTAVSLQPPSLQRLVEYGRNPHRFIVDSKTISWLCGTPIYMQTGMYGFVDFGIQTVLFNWVPATSQTAC